MLMSGHRPATGTFLFGMFALGACLAGPLPGQTEPAPPTGEPVVIELFYRQDSENSREALAWLNDLAQRRPGIQVLAHDVLEDPEQLKRVWALSKQFGYEQAQVPTFYLCNNLRVGFGSAETGGQRVEKLLEIRAFVRAGCQHCAAAKRFLNSLAKMRPALKITYLDVVQSYAARTEMQRVAQQYKTPVPSLPCIEVAGRLVVGYQTDAITGKKIESYFEHPLPAPQPPAEGQPAGEERSASDGDGTSTAPGEGGTGEDRTSPAEFGSGPALEIPLALGGLTFGAPASVAVSNLLGPSLSWRSPRGGHGATSSVAGGTLPPTSSTTKHQEERPPPQDADPLPPLPADIPLPADVDQAQPLPPPADGLTDAFPLPAPEATEQELEVPWLGTLSVGQLGMPLFTFLVGLIDGFNPCAMWVLVFLLSVLVNIKDRKKILVVAGTFVVVSGLAYFVFMAAWFNVFQLIGLLRPVQIGLGLLGLTIGLINVKDFFAFHKGVTLSIPESAKPGIYSRVRKIVQAKHLWAALTGAVVLAVVVNIVELLCTAGLPAMYTAILKLQDLPGWANYAYLGLYIVAYMLDDTLLVAVVVSTLSHRRLQESEGRWLKLLSGVVILSIALVLLFKPEWLG